VPQLLVNEYVIMAEPTDKPVTTPLVLTVAIDAEPLLQVPPVEALLSEILDDWQTTCNPVIVPAFGSGFTRTICVSVAVPQPLVTE
jgi:hypothetical protein